MNREFIGYKMPFQEYTIDVPPQYQAIYAKLLEATKIGGELYLIHQQIERDVLKRGIERDSDLARNPSTVPTLDGRWLLPHRHPDLIVPLRKGQSLLLSAASAATEARDHILADSLHAQGEALVDVEDKNRAWRNYLRGGTPINAHVLQIETLGGKERWQGSLGIRNEGETLQLERDIQRLRQAGVRIYGRWFTPHTVISVDDVGVMAGYISPQAQHELRLLEGLTSDFDLSAQNIPNPGELKKRYGSRITIFNGSFRYVLNDLDRIARSFMLRQPTRRAYLRSLAAHEHDHDDWPDDGGEERLGLMLPPLSESHAVTGGIIIAAEAWPLSEDFPDEEQHPLTEVIEGAIGYALRDCEEYLEGRKQIPDLEVLTGIDIHKPGSLGLLNLLRQERGIRVVDGKIAEINPEKVLEVCKLIEPRERDLLYTGREADAAAYFNEILPSTLSFRDRHPNDGSSVSSLSAV